MNITDSYLINDASFGKDKDFNMYAETVVGWQDDSRKISKIVQGSGNIKVYVPGDNRPFLWAGKAEIMTPNYDGIYDVINAVKSGNESIVTLSVPFVFLQVLTEKKEGEMQKYIPDTTKMSKGSDGLWVDISKFDEPVMFDVDTIMQSGEMGTIEPMFPIFGDANDDGRVRKYVKEDLKIEPSNPLLCVVIEPKKNIFRIGQAIATGGISVVANQIVDGKLCAPDPTKIQDSLVPNLGFRKLPDDKLSNFGQVVKYISMNNRQMRHKARLEKRAKKRELKAEWRKSGASRKEWLETKQNLKLEKNRIINKYGGSDFSKLMKGDTGAALARKETLNFITNNAWGLATDMDDIKTRATTKGGLTSGAGYDDILIEWERFGGNAEELNNAIQSGKNKKKGIGTLASFLQAGIPINMAKINQKNSLAEGTSNWQNDIKTAAEYVSKLIAIVSMLLGMIGKIMAMLGKKSNAPSDLGNINPADFAGYKPTVQKPITAGMGGYFLGAFLLIGVAVSVIFKKDIFGGKEII
jgi:hypothetical protein